MTVTGVSLRLAFMGTPAFAVPVLDAVLKAGHEVRAVYTQPPRPAGRGKAVQKSPVHLAAESHGLAVHTPQSMRDPAEIARFEALSLDAAVVVAYGQILVQRVLDAPRLGCFNLHASLLPRWRGAAPIHRAVMAGDAETGVMVMRMEAGLDTGPVLATWRTTVGPRITTGELHDRLSVAGAELMAQTLKALAQGMAVAVPQAEAGVTYAKKITNEEQQIDWTRASAELDCFVRGLSPAPGAWTVWKGERLKILLAEPVIGEGAPGTVLDERLTIACGTGAVRLLRLQRAGKAVQDADVFLRGAAIPPGTTLGR